MKLLYSPCAPLNYGALTFQELKQEHEPGVFEIKGQYHDNERVILYKGRLLYWNTRRSRIETLSKYGWTYEKFYRTTEPLPPIPPVVRDVDHCDANGVNLQIIL